MNIFRKIIIFIGCSLIVIGVVAIILSAALGGRLDNTHKGERTDIDTTYDNVKSINIDYRVGTLMIKEGDSFRIEAKNVLKDRFNSDVKDDVWTVSDKRGVLDFNTIFDWNKEESTVTLYLPKSTLLDECNFTLGAGKIDADKINTKMFKARVGAGEIVVRDLIAEDSDFDCGVGSIRIDGVISGDSKVNCGVGQISLTLKGDPNVYDYTVKVGIGSTRINEDRYSGVTDKKITNDNATGSFKLDCGIGEINLIIAP